MKSNMPPQQLQGLKTQETCLQLSKVEPNNNVATNSNQHKLSSENATLVPNSESSNVYSNTEEDSTICWC